MQAPERTDEEYFAREIFPSIVNYLARWLECISAEDGTTVEVHLPEAVIQYQIGTKLKSWLPSGELVQQNLAIPHGGRDVFIPDIVIERLAGGCWAVMEIKTMLAGDQLSMAQVGHDVNKLCQFKQAYPEAHCVFLLVTNQKRLLSMAGSSIWSALPLCTSSEQASSRSRAQTHGESIADGDSNGGAFDCSGQSNDQFQQAAPQDGRYIMVPTARSAPDLEIQVLAWEVGGAAQSVSLTEPYHFVARMGRPSGEETMVAGSRRSIRRERARPISKDTQRGFKQRQESK
jgi:hypothetical protein